MQHFKYLNVCIGHILFRAVVNLLLQLGCKENNLDKCIYAR